LQANIERWTIEASLSEENAKKNADRLAWAREKLAELEEQNKEVFAQHAAGQKQINDLELQLAQSETELTNANRAVTAATRNIEVIKNESAASEAEAKLKRDEANVALQKDIELQAIKSNQEGRKIELDDILLAVKQQAIDNGLSYNEFTSLVTQAFAEGYSKETILNITRARMQEQLEEQIKQRNKEAELDDTIERLKAQAILDGADYNA
jgi:hypothetical protein